MYSVASLQWSKRKWYIEVGFLGIMKVFHLRWLDNVQVSDLLVAMVYHCCRQRQGLLGFPKRKPTA